MGLCRRLFAGARSADALPLARALLAQSILADDPVLERRASGVCGLLAADTADVVGAIGYHSRALQLAEAERKPVDQSTIWNNIGLAFRMAGNTERAVQCYRRALAAVDGLPGQPARALHGVLQPRERSVPPGRHRGGPSLRPARPGRGPAGLDRAGSPRGHPAAAKPRAAAHRRRAGGRGPRARGRGRRPGRPRHEPARPHRRGDHAGDLRTGHGQHRHRAHPARGRPRAFAPRSRGAARHARLPGARRGGGRPPGTRPRPPAGAVGPFLPLRGGARPRPRGALAASSTRPAAPRTRWSSRSAPASCRTCAPRGSRRSGRPTSGSAWPRCCAWTRPAGTGFASARSPRRSRWRAASRRCRRWRWAWRPSCTTSAFPPCPRPSSPSAASSTRPSARWSSATPKPGPRS